MSTVKLCGEWMPLAKENCAMSKGHAGDCRTPRAAAVKRDWSGTHREQENARGREAYRTDDGKKRATTREYQQANPGKMASYRRKHRQDGTVPPSVYGILLPASGRLKTGYTTNRQSCLSAAQAIAGERGVLLWLKPGDHATEAGMQARLSAVLPPVFHSGKQPSRLSEWFDATGLTEWQITVLLDLMYDQHNRDGERFAGLADRLPADRWAA